MGFGLKGLRGERGAGGYGNGQGATGIRGWGSYPQGRVPRWRRGTHTPCALVPSSYHWGGGQQFPGTGQIRGVEGRSGAATRTQSSPGWWEVSKPRRAPGSACCRSAGTSRGVRARVGRSGRRGRRQPAGGWMGWRPSSTGETGAGSDPPPTPLRKRSGKPHPPLRCFNLGNWAPFANPVA